MPPGERHRQRHRRALRGASGNPGAELHVEGRRIVPADHQMPSSLIFALLFLTALALPAWSQSGGARVGLLGPDEQPRFSEIAEGLRQGLREQGYSEGRVEIVESRVPRDSDADARAAVANLMEQQLAVLFVIGSNLAKLARDRQTFLPIVFITPGDPVAAGLV